MSRQNLLLLFAIIFGACFAFAYVDSLSVSYYNWDCSFRCLHLSGKIAVIVAVMALIGGILTGLIRKKK